ncbi:MAG TPA: pyrroloquinoline quinone-dependent dehydrogenase [Granulicella sp.]
MSLRLQRLLVLFGILTPVSLYGQAGSDWPMYGHDGASTRFSPLKDINTANVANLKRAWTYHMAPQQAAQPSAAASPLAARTRQRRSETTPLMVDGVLYLPTPYNEVVALDATTGANLWTYKIPRGANASTRGVAYWPGDGKLSPRIVFGTSDGFLIALDAKTGAAAGGFGTGGAVDMKPGVTNDIPNARFSLSSPPQVYKNIVITGAVVQESPSLGASGDTRGWDMATGKLVWQFHSVPRPGEQGSETWETPDSWKSRSGVNVWGFISVDQEMGQVYLPYGAPTTDAYGADRKGANLFSNSLVVLDALTGKLKWYFQAVHHDTWDYDLESAPILATVRRSGKRIPAVVVTSKTGLVFILDRRDGKPVYKVEERPVPKSDVPGEFSIDYQPFPVKPEPLARQTFQKSDIATVTPEHQKFCEDLLNSKEGMHNDGPFTRYGMKPSIVFPGTLGATNWHGGSYDPSLNYVFYNTIELADIGWMAPQPAGSPLAYQRTGVHGPYDRFWDGDKYWPCQQPPWGQLVALNLDTGEYAWKVPLGTIPELDAKGIHNTGSMNMGGSIATAGGLVFISATNDHHFRAFESKTGKILWDVELEAGAYDTPITYKAKDGRQYVVIVASGGGYYDKTGGDSVAAFSLP